MKLLHTWTQLVTAHLIYNNAHRGRKQDFNIPLWEQNHRETSLHSWPIFFPLWRAITCFNGASVWWGALARRAWRPHDVMRDEMRNLQYGSLVWATSSLTAALAGGSGLAHSGMPSEENFGSHSVLDPLPTTAHTLTVGQCLLEGGPHQAWGWESFFVLVYQN